MSEIVITDVEKTKIRGIIEKNTEIVENSVSDFIVQCIVDNEKDKIVSPSAMTCALASVLSNALGGWRNVLGAVTNDERMFKWDTFDEYQHLFDDRGNKFYRLREAYSDCRLYYSRLVGKDEKVASDIKSVRLEADFTRSFRNPDMFTKFPAWIMMNNGPTSRDTEALIPKIPDDYYVGVYVSRDDYPNAIPGNLKEHHEIYYPKDRFEGRSQQMCLCDPDKGKVRHPGTIYLPAKKYAIKNDVYSISTMLPKHILESHGLPTGDI